jgi:predicted O-methyltransferase YrrM
MEALKEYYRSLGYPESRWHIGPEHPHLEDYAIRLLETLPRARVLEVGYQAGGFAVPLILRCHSRPDFEYLGIDSLTYKNAVDGNVIAGYLSSLGITSRYQFATGDAGKLIRVSTREFDLVLLDHEKRLYPREFLTIARRQLLSREGYILFHDVSGRAHTAWKVCTTIAQVYGYSWSVVQGIPGGLAVIRRSTSQQGITSFRQRLRLGMSVIRSVMMQISLAFQYFVMSLRSE